LNDPARAPWCFGRAFDLERVEQELARLDRRPTNLFECSEDEARLAHYYSEAVIAREPQGPPQPDGPFECAREMVARLTFSDPRIVLAHYDPRTPLLGRSLLLELRALGLRFLCGVRVTSVQDEQKATRSRFAFRYDTLLGHIECGSEWFVLTKHHPSGDVVFRIEARWRPGDFPNWWSRVGFRVVGRRYQRAWHRLAYLRLRRLLRSGPLPPLPPPGRILHEGIPMPVGTVHAVSGTAPLPDIAVERAD